MSRVTKFTSTKSTVRYLVKKLSKVKSKAKILKAAMEENQVTHKTVLICLTADVSAENL
jgi:hypothetical protein